MGRMLPFRLFRASIVGRERIAATSNRPGGVCSAAALFWGGCSTQCWGFPSPSNLIQIRINPQICFSPSLRSRYRSKVSTKERLAFASRAGRVFQQEG